jgi:hypothetical protein
MSTRDSYVAKAERQFVQAQSQLAALAAAAKEAVTAGHAGGDSLLRVAQSRHDQALHRLELLKRSGEESWDCVKASFETAWAELRQTLAPKA